MRPTARKNDVSTSAVASKRTARRGQAQSDAEIAELDSRAEEEVVPYDETLLDRARTQWQFGDWLSLARMNSDNFQYHPQRAKLALLAASGLFQQGDKNAAYRYIRLAQDWGCSRKLIVQMLASGTHNALACAAACFDQLPRAAAHLRSAVEIGGVPGDAELLTEARATRQFARAKSTNSKV